MLFVLITPIIDISTNGRQAMTTYTYTTDGIEFTGTFHVENDDEGYNPIFTVNSVYAMPCAIDLMLVIDPRVIHEIEAYLLSDYQWNTK